MQVLMQATENGCLKKFYLKIFFSSPPWFKLLGTPRSSCYYLLTSNLICPNFIYLVFDLFIPSTSYEQVCHLVVFLPHDQVRDPTVLVIIQTTLKLSLAHLKFFYIM